MTISLEGASSRVPSARRDHLVAVVIFVTTFAVFLASPVRPIGDSHYSMLLSGHLLTRGSFKIGRASCRERVCQYV